MPETTTLPSGEVIRSMTPVEYQKLHAEEEARERHVLDLHRFIAFMAGELRGGSLSDLTPEGEDRIIAAYLGAVR